MPPIPRHTRRIPKTATVGQAPLPLDIADTGAQAIGQGASRLGQSLSKLGNQLLQIRTAEDVADGVAQYNELMNRYSESLKDRSPEEYLEQDKDGQFVLPKQLQDGVNNILKGKTGSAARKLRNKFTVWNEANRASIGILAARDKSVEIRNTAPDRLSVFAQNEDQKGAFEYIDSITQLTGEQFKQQLFDMYIDLEKKNTIFRAINEVADNPTPENIVAARKIIDKLSKDEIDRYNNLNRLRTKVSSRSQIRDETYKAAMNSQSLSLAESYSSKALYEGELLPELSFVKGAFDARLTNGTLDLSTGVTYNSISQQIDEGEFFTDSELSSAYATGMSTAEYQDAVQRNKENARLTKTQRENLSKYNSYINDRYSQMVTAVRPKTSPASLPVVLDAVEKDKADVRKMVLGAIRAGKSSDVIYRDIENAFIADTDRLYQSWWRRSLFTNIGDIEPEVLGIDDRQERYEVITDLLKSGTKYDLQRLDAILKRWYE